jgi:hypothetical protein
MSDRSISALAWFAVILAAIAVVTSLLLAAGWQLGWWLLGGFLFCHGWVHFFVAVPTETQAATAGRRLGLTAGETRMVTLPLVAAAAVGFMLAGLATVMGSAWWATLIVVSSLVSLALLAFYYSRQLILGMIINAVLLAIVVAGVWRP